MQVYKKIMTMCILLGIMLSLIPVATSQDGPLAPHGVDGETYYAPFPVLITLDGETDDWEGVPHVLLSGTDTSVDFAAASDGEYLYLLGDVTDPHIISGEHGTEYWNEDSVEFYINGTADLGQRSYTEGIAQITVPALNMDMAIDEAILGGIQGTTMSAQTKVVRTDEGYRVEMAIPLQSDVLDIVPQHGSVIGFQVHLNGASTSGRDTKLIWSVFDTSDTSYQNPSVFGALIFYEVGQTELPVVESLNRDPTEIALVSRDSRYFDSSLPTAERIEDLLANMTLDEKIAQMTLVEKGSIVPEDLQYLGIGGLLSGGGGYPQGNNTPAGWAEMVNGYQDYALNSRLGIPLIYGVDAVHGHSNVEGTVIFPHNVGMGATRNPTLVEEACHITALEMIATGIYWNYAPVVAVPQDIRWGRSYEAYGEDTDLVSELSSACIRGLQGEDLADPTTVLATPKHFVGDGGTAWGSSTTGNYQIDQGVTEVDEATLREIHLPPYGVAIANGAQNIMISYSSWDGLKMHGQDYLINDVLIDEMGFTGFIVSDWGGMDQINPVDYYDSVVTSINAGVDMNMVPYDYFRFMDTVKKAVDNGDISIERIDEAVINILTVKMEMGLFAHPYSDPNLLDAVGSVEHRAVARQAVAESQVLLKNDGSVLPLDPGTTTIFVAGTAADDIGIQSGGWTIEWQGKTGASTTGTTILQGIEAVVTSDSTVYYDSSGNFNDAVDANGDPLTADVAIVIIGERPYAEGMGDDGELKLEGTDLRVLRKVQERADKVVVIILSGRPLIITDLIADWDAVVAAWLPGTEGQGVADTLFGYAPYTGQLPYTWPASVEQLPRSNEYEPLFPFGYGLETVATQE